MYGNPLIFTDRFGLLTDDEIAQRVFRETAGLRPLPKNPGSLKLLDEARRRIAGIADENPGRVGKPMIPDLNNSIEKREYDKSLCAAKNRLPPEKTRHFVLSTSRLGKSPDDPGLDDWVYSETDKIEYIYGPFRDVSGRTVKRKYIFFYTGVR